MINFDHALTGALRGRAKYFFNEALKESAHMLARIEPVQYKLIFTLMRINGSHELDGWRCVPGVTVDAG